MTKKINHRGRGGHRELLFSLCPLCSLWFFQNPFQKITKSLGFYSDWELLKCCKIPFVNIRGDLIETSREIYGLIAKNEKDFESDVSDSIREICRKFIVTSSQLPDSDDEVWSNHIEGTSIASVEILRKRRTGFDALSGL
jgi:hypothetical protein